MKNKISLKKLISKAVVLDILKVKSENDLKKQTQNASDINADSCHHCYSFDSHK